MAKPAPKAPAATSAAPGGAEAPATKSASPAAAPKPAAPAAALASAKPAHAEVARNIHPTADLEPRPGSKDRFLSLDEFKKLWLFSKIKKKPLPDPEKYPGSVILRKIAKGETLVEQGDPGATAFYILTAGDVERLLRGSATSPETESVSRDPKHPAAQAVIQVSSRAESGPATYIPSDSSAALSTEVTRAPLFEGEVFGEMACLNRQPRSASVVSAREIHVVELARNIFDQLDRNDEYRTVRRATYRERVLGGQLKLLPLFAGLPDAFYERLVRQELKDDDLLELKPNQILFHEHDEPDDLHFIWLGLLRVVKGGAGLFPSDATFKSPAGGLLDAPADAATEPAGRKSLRTFLSDPARTASDPRLALNGFIKALAPVKTLIDERKKDPVNKGRKAAELLASALPADKGAWLKTELEFLEPRIPDDAAKWSDLELRTAGRLLVEAVLADGVPELRRTLMPENVLAYLGPGDVVGEIGLVRQVLRTATCHAWVRPEDEELTYGEGYGAAPDQPDRVSRIEVVRIRKDVFDRLGTEFPEFRRRVERIADERLGRQPAKGTATSSKGMAESRLSARFDALGLAQGQRLMLVDLDRCTRCGECVTACINTHDDGRTRLYLDGPRIGPQLVPATCRQCRDPVCMIGCPVNSIRKGDLGNIIILDHCIGCDMCAKQCPYNAIQMHSLSMLAGGTITNAGATGKGSGRESAPLTFPTLWGWETQLGLGREPLFSDTTAEQPPVQVTFTVSGGAAADRKLVLAIESEGKVEGVAIAGRAVPEDRVIRGKKRTDPAAKVSFGTGEFGLVAGGEIQVRIVPPGKLNGTLVNARLDLLPEKDDVKAVEQIAVVCDMCESSSLGRPACVYNCPHEAALRLDGASLVGAGISTMLTGVTP
jgi:Fe-S-cluster-containing hydrogenase component 2